MSVLPILSGKDLCKVLHRIGYQLDHQIGSHIILRHKQYPHRRLTVPNHREVAKGTLRKIIRETGLSVSEFRMLW